jgi:choline monooxygenase
MEDLRTLIQGYASDLGIERASTPPSAWYTDARIARLERDAVFAHTWQMVGRLEQLQARGQFVTANIAGEPVVVVKSDAIRAFYNVCRHHGTQVVSGEAGCLKKLHCPYHGWTYALDGELLLTPNFDGVEDFDKSSHGLRPIRVETWENWVFVNLDPGAPNIKTSFASFHDALAPLSLDKLIFYERRGYTLDCNWKVFVDNFLDGGYHVPFIHKGLTSVLNNREYRIENTDSHCLQSCVMSEAKTDTGAVRMGEKAWYYWQYPNLMVNCYEGLEGVNVMDTNLVLPLGHERCRVVCDFWFADVSDKAQEHNDRSVHIADEIQKEDMGICASVQQGLNSRAYDTGRLSVQKEKGEYLFHQLLHGALTRQLDDGASTRG